MSQADSASAVKCCNDKKCETKMAASIKHMFVYKSNTLKKEKKHFLDESFKLKERKLNR